MEDDDPDRIERLWAEVAALRAQLTEFQIHRMQHEIATLRNQLAAPDETETDLLHDPEPIEASANAETFLREMLADHHEVPAETIWTAAHEKGISERTLKRVKIPHWRQDRTARLRSPRPVVLVFASTGTGEHVIQRHIACHKESPMTGTPRPRSVKSSKARFCIHCGHNGRGLMPGSLCALSNIFLDSAAREVYGHAPICIQKQFEQDLMCFLI